jgi:hypothetical protein
MGMPKESRTEEKPAPRDDTLDFSGAEVVTHDPQVIAYFAKLDQRVQVYVEAQRLQLARSQRRIRGLYLD